MPPPASVFQQPNVSVTAVPAWSLVPSPRNYNASIIAYDGRRLMAYRSHRMDQQGRCGIVVCELDAKWQAKPKSNVWLNLPEQVHSHLVHHEDPRLFVFRDRLHVAFTETQFHAAPQPYTCVMKYARLKPKGKGWEVERVFWPRFGRNDGSHQEKNWQFFDDGGRLRIIYAAQPSHHVLTLGKDGETVVGQWKPEGEGAKWPWGTIRGGTPPIKLPSGEWLTIFHSSTPYPIAPHWRRYYAGAYTFEGVAPFRITSISQKPILAGSEQDGHAHDPRNIDSWKPFVVFPSGLIREKGRLFVSYGINDYMTVVAEHTELFLGDPTFSSWGPKYFLTQNGNTPIRIFVHEDRPPQWLRWERSGRTHAGNNVGVLAVTDPRVAMHLEEEARGVEEISAEQYRSLKR